MAFFKRNKFASVIGRKNRIPDGLWIKCDDCKGALYRKDLEENSYVCPHCNHHYRMGARHRIDMIVDPDSFNETHADIETTDPLSFQVGDSPYLEKIEDAKKKSGLDEALVTGIARIEKNPAVLGVMESAFIMGSMGCAFGERFCRAAHDAISLHIPMILYVASGGARMQEGILSLMQMAKTANAVREMNESGTPYISILCDPTTGGVYASMASLGDIVLAEPGAHIGFTGPRLIEGALKVQLPEGFQKAEYQFKNGFIDEIVPRNEQRAYLAKLITYLSPATK